MTSKNKILFNLNLNAPNKIKALTLHPKKQWVALITTAHTFYLWNYSSKILIKSFNCNTLDDIKNFDIREMVFFDRYSLPYNISTPIKAQIIFVSAIRIYLYDYLTDAIKQINQKEIEQKNIKKVCAYSDSKICVSLNDGSFKILDSRDLYSKGVMTIKNIRGYHTKPITWMIPYCQNANQTPRIITVSSQDSLMACWNVETLLHANHIPDPATPSFKFLMQKGSKNDSNNGEQILSLQYDNSSYRLVTLTESYITIWSTMTGMELRRLKNNKYKQIAFFNHFSFGANCFLIHSYKSQLVLLRVSANDFEWEDLIEVKDFIKEGDTSIAAVRTLPQHPSQVFLCTQSTLLVIEINRFYRPSFGFHHSFITKLTTMNNKQFIIRSEGSFKSDIDVLSASKIPFEEDILFNSFYLSFEGGWIIFNLMEIQYENMLFEQRKYKLKRVAESSLFYKPTNSQALIEVRFDGRQFFVFNRAIAYYQIYGMIDSKSELLNLNQQQSNAIDFYSKLELVDAGHARDIVWHQYKQQFAAIKGFDKDDKCVEYISEKKGILGFGQRYSKLSGNVAQWRVCVFEKNRNQQYEIIFRSEPLNTKNFRVYNFGFLFGYSNEQNGTQSIVFINDEKNSNREIEGAPSCPERVFISYCQSYQIFAYDGQFVIYKVQENGHLSYFRAVHQTIHEGMFWEKIFFFSTKHSIFFMQITQTDVVLIKIADSFSNPAKKDAFFEFDDLENEQNLLPEGQLQMLTIINLHLMMLNYSGQIVLINLKNFPYIEFCLEAILGNSQRLQTLYNNSNQLIKRLMKETLNLYGIILHQLQ